MRRILLVSSDYSLTGAPLVLLQLARGLQTDYAVSMWSPVDGPVFGLSWDQGVPASYYPGHVCHLQDYDLVVANTLISYPTVLDCKRLGVPCLWWLHEGELVRKSLWQEPMREALNSCEVVVSTKYMQRLYSREGEYLSQGTGPHLRWIYPSVIPYGVPESADRDHPGCDGGVRFLVAGTVEWRKGQDLALKAFREVHKTYPQTSLTIQGSGWHLPWAQSLIHEYCEEHGVIFRGLSTPEAFSASLGDYDCLLCPSRDEGGFPQVLLQAQERGLLVIASDCCGMREQVPVDTGDLFPVDDCGLLQNLMGLAASIPFHLRVAGEKAREWAQTHNSLTSHWAAWKSLIAQTLEDATHENP